MMILKRLKSRVKRLLAGFIPAGGKPTGQVPPGTRPPAGPGPVPVHRRFLSDQPRRREAFLQGAREYVHKLDAGSRAYLYAKPYDPLPGNATYYNELYQVLNILRAMDLPGGARVLEVGSGPGWVTEILVMLGFAVDAIEPSEAMIAVARDRVALCRRHHHITGPQAVTFHCRTLEECDLPAGCFDGVLFHESLHHIIDEDRGLAQCFRLLKRGGVVGVTGEYVWWPGRREVEEDLEEEMARYGTLENPYTVEYLDWLFAKHGFEEVVRYHGVNGLVPVDLEGRTVKEVAQHPASQFQTLTARRPGVPGHTGPTTADPAALTRATITVLDTRLDAARARVSLQVRLANVGQTAWLPRGRRKGYVTLALRQGDPGGPAFREALPRHPLSGPVLPGQEVVLDATFRLPDDSRKGPWHLDLVSENVFWFSARGTVPAEVRLESR